MMPCIPFKDKDGKFVGIACTRGRGLRPSRCVEPGCAVPHTKLCDWSMGNGKTCDRKMCDAHATRVGDDVDYCPRHAAVHKNEVKRG